jgi:hypothetical protein
MGSALFRDIMPASCGNYLPTFQDNVSVTSSRAQESEMERESETCDVGSLWEGEGWVVISKNGNSQLSRIRVREWWIQTTLKK